jgi:hypothetical protein
MWTRSLFYGQPKDAAVIYCLLKRSFLSFTVLVPEAEQGQGAYLQLPKKSMVKLRNEAEDEVEHYKVKRSPAEGKGARLEPPEGSWKTI